MKRVCQGIPRMLGVLILKLYPLANERNFGGRSSEEGLVIARELGHLSSLLGHKGGFLFE